MSVTRKNRKSPARIIVYHCKSKNFGDGINPLIFNHFFKDTMVKPIYKDIETLPFHSETREPCILGVGSILSWNSKKDASNQIICGSGFIDKNKIPQKPRKIISIRGIKTRKKFLDAKIRAPAIYGDLALLLKFIIPPPKQIEKKYTLGIIPHYIDKDHPFIQKAKENPNWTIIDINQANEPERFIKQIHECDAILSSTLHGIIVSDSYGIPAYHIELSNKVIGGDWKFRDYYSSVKRTYSKINISEDEHKIKKQLKPYKIIFDFEKYYNYIKKSLIASTKMSGT